MNTIKSKHYSEIQEVTESTILTGNSELDSFLSFKGGFVRGGVVLLTGTPGAGKSTLAVSIQKMLSTMPTSLYCREVIASKLKSQTQYITISHGNDYIADKNDFATFDEYMKELNVIKPSVVFLDSLQVISKEDFPHMSEAEAAFHIIMTMQKWAADNKAVVFIIGHVNKDNTFEGANTTLQMVDAHMEMIYDKKNNTRITKWGSKNRFGDPTKTLFYKIEEPNGINFFSQKETTTFEESIMDAVKIYIDSIDKKSKNYSLFNKEFKVEIKTIFQSEKKSTSILIETIQLISSLIEKHDLNNN